MAIEYHCEVHRFCFRNKQTCVWNVYAPVTDFADKVIDDPEKLKKRIFDLEAILATINELSKG